MSTQVNVGNSQSATSIFFKQKTNKKSISKHQREDPEGEALVINTGTLSSLSQEQYKYQPTTSKVKKK